MGFVFNHTKISENKMQIISYFFMYPPLKRKSIKKTKTNKFICVEKNRKISLLNEKKNIRDIKKIDY